MEFYTLASGSSGNSTLIHSGNTYLLVDAGISCRKVTTRLAQLGILPGDLSAILVTHTHSDHISGLPVLLKKCAAPVYLSDPAGKDLLRRVPSLEEGRLCIIEPQQSFRIGEVRVTAFSTPHDAPGSVGFCFSAQGRRMAIATDLGYVTPQIAAVLDGVDAAILESNHDPDWLRDGPYPYPLQQRILGDHGHLSNEVCGAFAAQLAASGTRLLVLGHLSKENNTPERALQVVADRLSGWGEVQLWVAPRDELGGPFTV